MALETFTKGGVTLRIYRLKAVDIQLETLKQTQSLKDSKKIGVNGGFFNMSSDPALKESLLNIAYNNGKPIGSATHQGQPRDGSVSTIGDGMLMYDGKESKLRYYTTTDARTIANISSTGTWAQGGIAMMLAYEKWVEKATGTGGDVDSLATGRTALIGDMLRNEVLAIVALDANGAKTISYRMFRAAIQGYLGITDGVIATTLYRGIFLDGSNSSQMRVPNASGAIQEFNNPKENRKLVGIVTFKNQV